MLHCARDTATLTPMMRDLSRDRQWLALNTVTVKSWSLEQAIDGCARAGITAIAPWRDIVQRCGIERAARLLRASGLTVTCLCRGGMFTAADAAGRRAAIDDNRRAIDEAAAIGAGSLILVVGGLPPGSKDLIGAHRQVRDGIAAVLPHARAAAVPLAIEPLHPMTAADRACVNTLAHANDLCEELGEGIGVAIDAYHVWWDPDLPRQVARSAGSILSYHVCDWLVPTRDLVFDRGNAGRRHHRPPSHARVGRGCGLCRALRCRDSLRRELVEARSRRGRAHLHRTPPDRGVST
jgi:sugar phosphate isomerase/epimerase